MAGFGEPVGREEGGVGPGAGGVDVDVYVSGCIIREMKSRICGLAGGVLDDFGFFMEDGDGEIL